MNILAFDTSGEILSLCLLLEHGSREITIDQGMRHVQSLMPEIDRIVTDGGIKKEDIDLIVTARGPGSFTGLRIGITTAKGLSEALSIPFVAIPGLDAIAFSGRFGNSIPILPLIDARKGRFYGALYGGKNGQGGEYFDLAPKDIINLFSDNDSSSSGILLTGPGAPLFFERESEHIPKQWLLDPLCRKGTAFSLAILGKAAYNDRGGDDPGIGPLYLRKSEAELSRKK